MERRLAAVVIADVVGYSRLIRLDEEGTRARFQALSEALFAPLVRSHGGRIIKTMGDAFLIEFHSAVEAVAFAVEVQQAMVEREAAEPADRRLRFRIGINMGDVIVEGDDIHGDGVNIAARLEAIARPNGICISAKVRDEVRGTLDLAFADGGLRTLKNIDEAIHVYHIGGDAGEPESDVAAGAKDPKWGSYAKPVVSVLPVRAIGRGEGIAELAEGLHEAILSSLTGHTALSVVRDQEDGGADYLLEGGVRGAGARVRVTFALRDAEKGTEVWAERYDRTLDDVFELEDEISLSVVSFVRNRLKQLEMEQFAGADNASLGVEQLLSKAAGYLVRSPGNNDIVRNILDLARAKDPDSSMAHAMTALCIWRVWEHSPLAIAEADREAMIVHSNRALELDRRSYFALLIAAICQEELFGNDRAALDYAEQALQLNPSFTPAQGAAAIATYYLGDARGGRDMLRRAIETNREDPYRFRHQRAMAVILAMEERFAEATDLARRLVRQAPDLHRNVLVAAGIFALAGDAASARQCLSDLCARYPDLTVTTMRAVRCTTNAQAERFRAALIEAGLPEAV